MIARIADQRKSGVVTLRLCRLQNERARIPDPNDQDFGESQSALALPYSIAFRHSDELLCGELTSVLTGYAVISSAGYGLRRACSRLASSMVGSSHNGKCSGGNITGIRL